SIAARRRSAVGGAAEAAPDTRAAAVRAATNNRLITSLPSPLTPQVLAPHPLACDGRLGRFLPRSGVNAGAGTNESPIDGIRRRGRGGTLPERGGRCAPPQGAGRCAPAAPARARLRRARSFLRAAGRRSRRA